MDKDLQQHRGNELFIFKNDKLTTHMGWALTDRVMENVMKREARKETVVDTMERPLYRSFTLHGVL